MEQFLGICAAHGVEQICDVRTIPKSLHNPQFGQDELGPSLEASGRRYHWLGNLGGLRHAHKDSINLGWRNLSFRGFADYMQTPEFAAALTELEELARERPTAIMCAEAVPWRCHRGLIGDALMVRHWKVLDIMSATTARLHHRTPFLVVKHGVLTYPAPPEVSSP